MSDWWRKKLAAERAAKARTEIEGVNPLLRGVDSDLQAQRLAVGHAVRQWFDSGFESETLVQSLVVGAVWLADNLGISRDALVEIIRRTELKKERQLIYRPDGS